MSWLLLPVLFVRNILWLALEVVMFGGAIAAFVCDLEAIQKFFQKYKILKLVLIVGLLFLLWKKGFTYTLGLLVIVLDMDGIWALVRRRKERKAYEGKRAKEKEAAKNAAEAYEKAESLTSDPVQAREFYRQAAELGHQRAQYQYGWYCLQGIGGEKDPVQAFENLMKADGEHKEETYDEALRKEISYALGLCYSQGIGTVADDGKALEKLEWAMARNSWKAADYAAAIYKKRGKLGKAESAYRLLTKRGDASAMYELARILMAKTGDWKEHRQALELWEAVRLADESRETECEKAIETVKVSMVEEQKKEAKVYFEAEKSDKVSLEQAKELYDNCIDVIGREQDYRTAAEQLEKAAFGGYAPAELLYGYLVAKGFVKNENPFIAAGWVRRAVEQGCITDALVNYDWLRQQDAELADRVLELGKEKDYAFVHYEQGMAELKAGNSEVGVAELKRAADAGYVNACYELAVWMLSQEQEKGQISEDTFRKALDLLQKAVNQEHSKACYLFGAMMEKAHPEAAAEYFEIAAQNGDTAAMAKLVLLYENREDREYERLCWWDKLAMQGERGFVEGLSEAHMKYVAKLNDIVNAGLKSDLPMEDYRKRESICYDAILETGKAIFWRTCKIRRPKDADEQVSRIRDVQDALYEKKEGLEELMGYAVEAEYHRKEIEKIEREQEWQREFYERQRKEAALHKAEVMNCIFGPEAGVAVLAREFSEEIKNDWYLRMLVIDVDPSIEF